MTATTTDQRCERTELYVADCAHCRRLDLPAEFTVVRRFRVTGAIAKRINATCGGCEQLIEAGGYAAKTADGQYLHEECVP